MTRQIFKIIEIKCPLPIAPYLSTTLVNQSSVNTTVTNFQCITNWKWSDNTSGLTNKVASCRLNGDSFTASWNISGGFTCQGSYIYSSFFFSNLVNIILKLNSSVYQQLAQVKEGKQLLNLFIKCLKILFNLFNLTIKDFLFYLCEHSICALQIGSDS